MVIKKRNLSLSAIALSTVLALSACSGGGGSTPSASPAASAPGGKSAEPLPEVTIDVLSMLTGYAGMQEGWFAKVVKDKFNIKLNFLASGDQVVPSRMASGDMGDLVVWGSKYKEYTDSIKAGLLMDWNKDGLLDKYGMNIKKHAAQAIEANAKQFGGGKAVYGIGNSVSSGDGNSEGKKLTFGPSIRWDLYQKLGSPKLTKFEDYLSLLKKMQELEPKSDSGKKTYGFSLWTDWDGNFVNLANIGQYFGYTNGDNFNPSDMLLVSAAEQKYQGLIDDNSYYMKGLEFYYKANQMGLLDPDSVTQKFGDVMNKLKDGQYFFIPFTWMEDSYNYETHTSAGKGLKPVPFEGQKNVAFGHTPYGGGWYWSIGSKAKDPARIMMFLDWMYSPEGMMTMSNGPKGLTWDLKDGKPYVTEFGWKAYMNAKETEIPAEYGGGTYDSGVNKINNSTISYMMVNPETGEPYNHDMWKSSQDHAQTPVDKSWIAAMGAVSQNEYFTKNNMTAVTKQTFTGAPPATLPSDIQQKQNEVGKVIKEYSWKMIISKNEDEYNKLKQQMISKAKGLGYDQVVAWQVEQLKKTVWAPKQ
jgi:putative aldouronate transport system substrate-binding protein